MSISRWKTAHKAEKDHPTHEELISREHTDHILSEHGLSHEEFAGQAVLAVGGGTGIIHRLDTAARAVSLDPISSDLSGRVQQSSASVLAGAGEQLPFPDASFDWIICRNVIDHTVSPEKVFEEVRRVLKPDGRFWFSVNVFELPATVRNRLHYIDRPHPHHFSINEIETIAANHGFAETYDEIYDPSEETDNNIKRHIAIKVFGMKKLRKIYTIG